jgi:hypothetical protein
MNCDGGILKDQALSKNSFDPRSSQHNLCEGDVAVVVEHLPPTPETKGEDGYALEVYNAVGETVVAVMVPASAVKPLSQDEILRVRTLR